MWKKYFLDDFFDFFCPGATFSLSPRPVRENVLHPHRWQTHFLISGHQRSSAQVDQLAVKQTEDIGTGGTSLRPVCREAGSAMRAARAHRSAWAMRCAWAMCITLHCNFHCMARYVWYRAVTPLPRNGRLFSLTLLTGLRGRNGVKVDQLCQHRGEGHPSTFQLFNGIHTTGPQTVGVLACMQKRVGRCAPSAVLCVCGCDRPPTPFPTRRAGPLQIQNEVTSPSPNLIERRRRNFIKASCRLSQFNGTGCQFFGLWFQTNYCTSFQIR